MIKGFDIEMRVKHRIDDSVRRARVVVSEWTITRKGCTQLWRVYRSYGSNSRKQ
jgi:hypothetical protein